jgi:glycosyltransferase involved in cell wall biosynthesis
MISIVMTYYNRPQQLTLTLKSIEYQHVPCEIIIVDDASDESLKASQVIKNFENLNIKLVEIPKSEKWWINPSISYNKGFSLATGDIVVIQNAENMHVGPVLSSIDCYCNSVNYLVFSCYSLTEDYHKKLSNFINYSELEFKESISHLVPQHSKANWYTHPSIFPKNYHFCTALYKTNLDRVGGFNEEFAKGYCWEDNEFLLQVIRTGLILKPLELKYGYVYHQWHSKTTKYFGACSEWYQNKKLYENILNRGGR